MNVALVIPTLNAGAGFAGLLAQVGQQDCPLVHKIIADSGSTDNTAAIAKAQGWEVIDIPRGTFNHGTTRQLCMELHTDIDIVIFITQDILFFDNTALSKLVAAFADNRVGAAYGRQLPHKNASAVAAQARLFNYPAQSYKKTYADKAKLGIKTPFMSDSFAAYRVAAVKAVGGFPQAIVSEDMYVGAKLIKQDWKIAYQAEAKVYHSHNYSFKQEFKRYFDIGVFMSREGWLKQEFGAAEGEGLKLVLNQLKYLKDNKALGEIPGAFIANFFRLAGYKLGQQEAKLPLNIKRLCSGQPYFFN